MQKTEQEYRQDIWLQNRQARALDKARTKLLRQMFEGRDWRKLSTLSRVSGTDA